MGTCMTSSMYNQVLEIGVGGREFAVRCLPSSFQRSAMELRKQKAPFQCSRITVLALLPKLADHREAQFNEIFANNQIAC